MAEKSPRGEGDSIAMDARGMASRIIGAQRRESAGRDAARKRDDGGIEHAARRVNGDFLVPGVERGGRGEGTRRTIS